MFFPASVGGAAAASPGHPEPGEPPVPAGPDVRGTAIRTAQMATVHPVQDGPGGDPVVGGGVAVLSHVTHQHAAVGPCDQKSNKTGSTDTVVD